MIICAEHGNARFLEIEQSRIRFEDDELVELEEHYRCQECKTTGEYHFDDGYEKIMGEIKATNERPRTVIDGKWDAWNESNR